MNDWRILCSRTCRKCYGAGVMQHPEWERFWQAHDPKQTTEQTIEDWFSTAGHPDLPPEEITCDECDGSGYVKQWISIDYFATLLKHRRND